MKTSPVFFLLQINEDEINCKYLCNNYSITLLSFITVFT